MDNKRWVVYLVRCSDNSLYCGISNAVNNRLIAHNSGKGAKYTRSRRPVKLVGVSRQLTKSVALQLEYRIKRLPKDKKIAELTSKANEMTVLKSDLQILKKDIKALEKKMEKLIAVAEKSENSSADIQN